jgi:hypothetical protein
MDSHSTYALFVRGYPNDRGTYKSYWGGGDLNLKVGLDPQENV